MGWCNVTTIALRGQYRSLWILKRKFIVGNLRGWNKTHSVGSFEDAVGTDSIFCEIRVFLTRLEFYVWKVHKEFGRSISCILKWTLFCLLVRKSRKLWVCLKFLSKTPFIHFVEGVSTETHYFKIIVERFSVQKPDFSNLGWKIENLVSGRKLQPLQEQKKEFLPFLSISTPSKEVLANPVFAIQNWPKNQFKSSCFGSSQF